jgi:hypothetical protein
MKEAKCGVQAASTGRAGKHESSVNMRPSPQQTHTHTHTLPWMLRLIFIFFVAPEKSSSSERLSVFWIGGSLRGPADRCRPPTRMAREGGFEGGERGPRVRGQV